MLAASEQFRYIEDSHSYWIGDRRIPAISDLLRKSPDLMKGSAFFTEASRRRGQAVHALCADFDLGVLVDVDNREFEHKGFVVGYRSAVRALESEWDDIEVADFHPEYLYGGRADRVGLCIPVLGSSREKVLTVGEIKTGAKSPAHPVQLALQALLVACRRRVDAHDIQRVAIHPKESGRFSVEPYNDPRDFLKAMDLIRRFAC